MKTVDFQVKKSLLGFGTMRLPVNEQGKIDDVQVREMIVYTMSHGGESETVIGCVLKEYPRDSYYLATKYSGHHILSSGYNAREIFEEQLVKCEVDDFDFYLLHNVYEKSMETYLDPVWGIEPVCGGKLANLDEETEIQMKKLRPDESIPLGVLDSCRQFQMSLWF